MASWRAARRSFSWRASASHLEEAGRLPVLSALKGLPIVHTASPSSKVQRAIVDMCKYRAGALVVMDEGVLAGIITERDIFNKLSGKVGETRGLRVAELMTPGADLTTACGTTSLDTCVRRMKLGHLRHLPIVQKSSPNIVKAIVSMRDIAAAISAALSKKKPLSDPPLLDELNLPGAASVGEDDSVADAVSLMRAQRIGSVAVLGPNGEFGLFTERDYLTKVAVYDEKAPAGLMLSQVATPAERVRAVERSTSVPCALRIMVAAGCRHLPIVESKTSKELVGMCSMRDLLGFLVEDEK